ncbi:MAG: peptidoglycan DD-metalloendopeptidase family protein [Prolixibacteraceae bacterium]|jgi:murein DD-endopeptidase MepM/ murein hydrolase activator NlpD|nr:peptidoglycan DD-metalloendopeptidase family protein [Prolixibacteraceae bacterium]
MANDNYRFNPETLSYDKVEINFKERMKRTAYFLGSSFIFALVISFLTTKLFQTDKELELIKKNEKLKNQFVLMNKDMKQMSEILKDVQYRDNNIYRVIFEADPIPSKLQEVNFDDVNKFAELSEAEDEKLTETTSAKINTLFKQLYIQSKSYDEVLDMALNKEKMLTCIPSIQPISNKDLKRAASGWGMRVDPIYKIPKFHYGMDFSAPIGTEIFSTGNGVVRKVIKSKVGYGLHILVDHGYGYETLYAHMSKFNVKQGQKVHRGDVIGFVGSTGKSTGPHLHYEVHKNKRAVNPQNFYFQDLTAEEYEKMIEYSSNMGQSFD